MTRRAIVQYSTGAASAYVGFLAVTRYGVENTVLLSADTRVEDHDNWRFALQVWKKLGQPRWVKKRDGRTPMEVGRDHRAIPNNRMAICSRVLKRELLRTWIDANCDPANDDILLGFDWTEDHRLEQSRPHWEPFNVVAPLMDAPFLDKKQILAFFTEVLGIGVPALYAEGFQHANCGGGCVRSGQAQWALLLQRRPATYAYWEAEEEKSRDLLGDFAILRDRRGGTTTPMSLRAFRERLQAESSAYDHDDWGVCGCTIDDETETAVRLGRALA